MKKEFTVVVLQDAILRVAAANNIEAWVGYDLINRDDGTFDSAVSVYVPGQVDLNYVRTLVQSSIDVQIAMEACGINHIVVRHPLHVEPL